MSRFATVAVIAALTIGVTAVAQENRKPRKQPNQSDRAAVAAEKPAAAPATKPARSMRGEIQAVDIEGKTVTVTTKKKGEDVKVVVQIDAATDFTLDDAKATLVDLKPGMKVIVTPDTGIATKVAARSVKEQPKRNNEQAKRNSASAQAKRRAGNSGKQSTDASKESPSDSGTAGPSKAADHDEASPKSEQ